MPLAAGSRLGPYEVVSLLGAGGMGEVYRARDSRLSRDVAIKVLPPVLAADEDRVERFRIETKATGALNHPNILAVYDTGNENGLAFIVSELLEGRTLRDVLANGRLGERRSVAYGIQIARGLAAVHARGIVHRDLKPENVFVTNDGVVKILDFGLAKLTASIARDDFTRTIATDAGTIMGTAGYMAPEQLRGGTVDTHSDVFSFGAVLYEMLSGRRAFDGSTAADSASAILKDDPAELENVNPALNRIVLRCLEKDPRDRFDSSRDLAFALEALSGSVTSAVHGPVTQPRKHPGVFAALAALCIATVAGSAWFLSRAPEPQIPTYKRISFGRGVVNSARFTPEGNAVIYSAVWDYSPEELFSVRLDQPEARRLGVTSTEVASISPGGDMALIQRPPNSGITILPGILSRAPLSGGAPREMIKDVLHADWSLSGEIAIARQVDDKIRIELPPGHMLHESQNLVGWMRIHPGGKIIAAAERPVGMGSRWTLFTVDTNGTRSDLVRDLEGEGIQFAWASGNTLMFQMGSIGGGELRSVSTDGKISTVQRFPIPSEIFDVAKDGRILTRRTLWRASTIGSSRSGGSERDLSWMDASEVDAISPDGKQLLMTEFGEGGGQDRWSVYLRKADGSPAVRLGEGQALALSPDRQFALTMRRGNPPSLVLVATGAGEAKVLPNADFTDYSAATFMPGGKKVIVCGTHKTFGARLFLQDIDTGKIHPVTPRGTYGLLGWQALSPDGRWVIASGSDRQLRLYSVANPSLETHPEPIRESHPGDRAARWLGDGRSFYLFRGVGARTHVFVVNPWTGQTRLWKEWTLADPAGVDNIYTVQIASDDDTFFYSYLRRLSDLYVIEGLRGP